MGDFIQAIANGIAGLVIGALQAIGSVLRGMVANLDATMPGGWLAAIAFVVALITAWNLAKR